MALGKRGGERARLLGAFRTNVDGVDVTVTTEAVSQVESSSVDQGDEGSKGDTGAKMLADGDP